MQFILRWLLHTSVFAGLCALALCMAAEKLLSGTTPPLFTAVHALVFGATLVEYNIHHLFNHKRVFGLPDWSKRDDFYHGVVLATGLLLCLAAFPFLSLDELLFSGALGVLALAYSTPILPFRYKRRLKDYGLIKILVLTSVWVLITTALPAVHYAVFPPEIAAEMGLRFLLIFPLCVAFDIRDTVIDSEKHINTLPNALGLRNSYIIIYLSLALLVVKSIGIAWLFNHAGLFLTALTSGVWALIAIQRSRIKENGYTYLLWIDGAMLVHGLAGIFLF